LSSHRPSHALTAIPTSTSESSLRSTTTATSRPATECSKKLLGTIAKDYSYGYSYLALCCWDLGQWDEFLDYLHEAVKRNANEARLVLGRLFPDEMPVEQYEAYIKEQLDKTKQ